MAGPDLRTHLANLDARFWTATLNRAKLQSAARRYLAQKRHRMLLATREAAHSFREAAIIALQRMWRARAARASLINGEVRALWLSMCSMSVRIQATWRGYLLRKELEPCVQGITKFQALCRGHSVRLPVEFAKVYDELQSSRQEIAALRRHIRIIQGARNHNVCPITQDAIREPVLCLLDGQQYEKYALLEWLQENETSPVTRAAIVAGSLIDATPSGYKALYERLAQTSNSRKCEQCN
jgi:hypothetical protein